MWDEKYLAETIIKKYQTNNPFKIAKARGIFIRYKSLGEILGYFNTYKQIKMIHINQDLNSIDKRFVCAHELGHELQHPKINTPFLRRNTLFSVAKIEREANSFAVELLLPDSILREYQDTSFYTLAALAGIPQKLAGLKNFYPK